MVEQIIKDNIIKAYNEYIPVDDLEIFKAYLNSLIAASKFSQVLEILRKDVAKLRQESTGGKNENYKE